SASSLKMRTRIGEVFGIFFCRSSASKSDGSSLVALAGNLGAFFSVLFSALVSAGHAPGVSTAANAAVSTSARSTVARIIAVPPDVEPLRSQSPYSVAFVGQIQSGGAQMLPDIPTNGVQWQTPQCIHDSHHGPSIAAIGPAHVRDASNATISTVAVAACMSGSRRCDRIAAAPGADAMDQSRPNAPQQSVSL